MKQLLFKTPLNIQPLHRWQNLGFGFHTFLRATLLICAKRRHHSACATSLSACKSKSDAQCVEVQSRSRERRDLRFLILAAALTGHRNAHGFCSKS